MKPSREVGFSAEEVICHYLLAQGLEVIARNFSCRMGEIDLIMQDRDMMVFVEVRYRKNALFGGAVASVTHAKQKKLLKTALFYRLMHHHKETDPFRFDVVGLEGTPAKIEWIKNAF